MKKIACILFGTPHLIHIQLHIMQKDVVCESLKVFKRVIHLANTNQDDAILETCGDMKAWIEQNNLPVSTVRFGIYFPDIFMERIRLPKLNKTEAKKALQLELFKLYPNYLERYLCDIKQHAITKDLVEYQITFCAKEIVQTVYKIANAMKWKVSVVSFLPSTVYQWILKQYTKEKTSIFLLCITEKASDFIWVDHNMLVDCGRLDVGMIDLDMNIAQSLAISYEEAKKKRLNQEVEKLGRYIERSFMPVTMEMRRLGGCHFKDIGQYFICGTQGSVDEIKQFFEKRFKIYLRIISNPQNMYVDALWSIKHNDITFQKKRFH